MNKKNNYYNNNNNNNNNNNKGNFNYKSKSNNNNNKWKLNHGFKMKFKVLLLTRWTIIEYRLQWVLQTLTELSLIKLLMHKSMLTILLKSRKELILQLVRFKIIKKSSHSDRCKITLTIKIELQHQLRKNEASLDLSNRENKTKVMPMCNKKVR